MATALLALVVAGCGGGGGGASVGRSASFYETEEYFASGGLDRIRASSAYAAGATGRGITVAVIDTGVDVAHPEFAGALAPGSTDIVSGNPASLNDEHGHGTAVAGIVGARRNGLHAHGVAFESGILAIRADTVGSCASVCNFAESDVAAATDHAVANGAQVINYSMGGAPALGPGLESAFGRAVDAGAILVMAAGNNSAAEPDFPGRFAGSAAADGRAIVVGAVDADNTIAGFSNRAGATRDSFLVAPGVQILAPVPGGGAALTSGTSMSAPHVSGAAALVLQAAPFLRAEQVVELLLASATDLGAPGPDPVYGRGLLDLRAALRPQGTLNVPLGASVDADLVPLAESSLSFGPAFGRGPSLGRAIFLDGYGRPYRFELDELKAGRDRRPHLLGWLTPAPSNHAAEVALDPSVALGVSFATTDAWSAGAGRLPEEWEQRETARLAAGLGSRSELVMSRGWGLGGEFGLAAVEPSLVGQSLAGGALVPAHLRLAGGGDAISFGQDLGDGFALRGGVAEGEAGTGAAAGGTRLAVAELRRQWPAGAVLGLQLGYALEERSLLEATGGGALALGDGAATSFLGVGGLLPLPGRLELFGQLSYGATRADDGAAGMVQEISTLESMAFAAGVGADEVILPDDRLSFTLSQPLRVVAGSAVLDLPAGRTLDGEVLRERARVDLVPRGRELDFELGYRIRLERNNTLSLVWLSRVEPGHDRRRSTDHALALRLRHLF